jgi:methylated-DNA-[protein]-cysteine S-methyltransferase
MPGAVATLDSPVGPLTLAASDAGLTHLVFGPRDLAPPATPAATRWLDVARRELAAYFEGRLRTFTVPADLERVTGERRAILDALAHVGYGETASYGALAAAAGLDGDGPRRVGVAMARNPVAIVVPCHRVIGADGSLTGYGGGLAAKRWLLDLEAAQPSDRPGQLVLPL